MFGTKMPVAGRLYSLLRGDVDKHARSLGLPSAGKKRGSSARARTPVSVAACLFPVLSEHAPRLPLASTESRREVQCFADDSG